MKRLYNLILSLSVSLVVYGCSDDNEKSLPVSPDPVPSEDNTDPFDECEYSQDKTVFSLWCPSATDVEVRLYADCNTAQYTSIDMRKADGDIWQAEAEGDQNGKFYTFRTRTNGKWNAETPGIFAKAVSVNGRRAAIIDFASTNPSGWNSDARPSMPDISRAVIYELHFRDISMHRSSGISNKGKFLALTEHGTTTTSGLSTGIDHIKELGVTHVQIMPSTDFASIDESALSQNKYNWGYEPLNYNAPEGSYSTDPYSPAARIKEMKQMVMACHKAGIRVVLDVVYNHTADVSVCALGQVTPGYFYRHNADGSLADGTACGNETASEKEMMRRFMIESVKYWANEYHIDGFRFDLMAVHDIETMRQIRTALSEIDPAILVYGEGWAASTPAYDNSLLAFKSNMTAAEGVGAFSDDIRDALVGSPFDNNGGFVTGKKDCSLRLKFGLTGAVYHSQALYTAAWCSSPLQHISYVSCHDDLCLRDKLKAIMPEASENDLLKMDKLAQTAVLTSQGIPFIFCGEEIFRTKQGVKDSFESPDEINAVNWSDKAIYGDLYNYYKDLIALRQSHPGFHLGTADKIRAHVEFIETYNPQLVVYRIKDLEGIDSAKSLTVVFNGSNTQLDADIPVADYAVLARDGQINLGGMESLRTGTISVAPVSATILAEY